jgi:hypothetical protein
MNEKSIMVDIGAKYNATKAEWQFPATDRYINLFDNGVGPEGVPFPVVLDSVLFRQVGNKEEAWVLFRAGNVAYNFARYEKKGSGWYRKALHYKIYEGAPSQYSTDLHGFTMIGTKTYINILETFAGPNSTTAWILIDPFDRNKRSAILWASIGEKDWDSYQYVEYETEHVDYEDRPDNMPDLLVYQTVELKTEGKEAQKSKRVLRYRHDAVKNEYFLQE